MNKIYSPVTGILHPITEAPDEVFSQKMMGDGYMIYPTEGLAVSPVDGKVTLVFPTKHAIGLKADDGTECMLHIGVDTVKLEGKGFEALTVEGQEVKKGDKLIMFDIDYIKTHAASEACLVVFTGGQQIYLQKKGAVEALDEIGYY